MTHENKWALLEPIAAIVLWLVCLLAPWLVFHYFDPVWGLGSAVAAFGLYAWLGPRPIPGFLPGLLSMGILLGSFACSGMCLIVITKHALHGGH